jgi:radical SAM superfamily enzyme YgiQ (UPF0313 family)
MRILLINPSQLHGEEIYPSGALILMGTMLKRAGHQVWIIHPDQLYYTLLIFRPDYVCLTINTYQIASAIRILKFVKSQDKEITTVVGGPHPSACEVGYKNTDIVIQGEGENTLLEIVNQGITSGKYHGKKDDLDNLPLPDLSLVQWWRYTGLSRDSMYIMCSRGCPFKCTYCNKSVFGNTVRYRKPHKILEEVRHLQNYGIREIFFQDDTFNLNRIWVEEIFKGIISEKTGLRFKMPFRVDRKLIDLDLLKLAKRAGVTEIFYGVESGNQEMLNTMKKGTRIADIERAFRLTRKAGIKTTASFMIGNVGETQETVKDSINLMKKIKPTYASFGMAIPFPGTVFREELEKRGHLKYECYSSKSCVVRSDTLDYCDIRKLHTKANLWAALFCPGTRWRLLVKCMSFKYIKYLWEVMCDRQEVENN